MVAHQAKCPALRKDCGFIVDGAICEMENQLARHLIAAGYLDQIAVSEDFAFQRAQHQKAMKQTLSVAHWYGLGWNPAGPQERGGCQQNRAGHGLDPSSHFKVYPICHSNECLS